MLPVIRQARRRLLANELFAQAANAFGAALLAFILLLLAGTELLRWEWLVLLPAAAAGIGLFAALKRLPSPYATAQIIDRRMGLADTLSTAWFFGRTEWPRASSGMLRGQREQADRISRTLDVRRAIPFKMPRSAYAVAALALLASSLFALRYGITRRLDLHPPLARILEQRFGFERNIALARTIRHQRPIAGQADDPGEDAAAQDPNQSAQPETSESQDLENPSDPPAGKKEPGHPGDKGKQAENAGQQTSADRQDEQDEQDEQQPENTPDPRGGRKPNQQGKQSAQGKQSDGQQDGNGGESSSLLSKMKDALQNLLSRVKPQSSPGSEQSKDQNAGQQGKDQQNGGKQQSAKDSQHDLGGQQPDSPEGQSGEQAVSSPDSRGNPAGKSDAQQSGKQPGSGVGSQSGDKALKQAEQLAAMGKISEIIGKRSANLTGEATVEVQSSSQQLRTAYAQRDAEHFQGGAEINRDEIPVALEAYVAKYFEQVRKQARK
jgi:hypothetical protein